jgi:hypothetical protein
MFQEPGNWSDKVLQRASSVAVTDPCNRKHRPLADAQVLVLKEVTQNRD